nr:MAG TPA: Translocation protein Sec62 [Caudoviricetes sp.]
MKIRTKAFLILQIAVALVTAIIMTIYWMLIGYKLSEPTSGFDGLYYAAVSIISFSIILFPIWKFWRGKSWYSLSLLFLFSIAIIALVLFILANILNGEIAFVIACIGILYTIIAAPAYLIIACIIGLLGKYLVNRFSNDIS